MSKIIDIKPVINKRNGQLNFSLSKKDMPKMLRNSIKQNPKSIKSLKIKLEGFE